MGAASELLAWLKGACQRWQQRHKQQQARRHHQQHHHQKQHKHQSLQQSAVEHVAASSQPNVVPVSVAATDAALVASEASTLILTAASPPHAPQCVTDGQGTRPSQCASVQDQSCCSTAGQCACTSANGGGAAATEQHLKAEAMAVADASGLRGSSDYTQLAQSAHVIWTRIPSRSMANMLSSGPQRPSPSSPTSGSREIARGGGWHLLGTVACEPGWEVQGERDRLSGDREPGCWAPDLGTVLGFCVAGGFGKPCIVCLLLSVPSGLAPALLHMLLLS